MSRSSSPCQNIVLPRVSQKVLMRDTPYGKSQISDQQILHRGFESQIARQFSSPEEGWIGSKMPRRDDESLGRLFFELNQDTQDFEAGGQRRVHPQKGKFQLNIAVYGRMSLYDCARATDAASGGVWYEAEFWRKATSLPIASGGLSLSWIWMLRMGRGGVSNPCQ